MKILLLILNIDTKFINCKWLEEIWLNFKRLTKTD